MTLIVKDSYVLNSEIRVGSDDWFTWLAMNNRFQYIDRGVQYSVIRLTTGKWRASKGKKESRRRIVLGHDKELTQHTLDDATRLMNLTNEEYSTGAVKGVPKVKKALDEQPCQPDNDTYVGRFVPYWLNPNYQQSVSPQSSFRNHANTPW